MKNFLLMALCFAGCDTPTTGVVVNAFIDDTVVARVWWSATLFADPVAPGETSAEQRLVPSSDTVYALLSRKGALVAVKSLNTFTVDRSEVLNIELGPSTITGDCAAGPTLTADEAELITKRLFPGQFVRKAYDPATCRATDAADGGR